MLFSLLMAATRPDLSMRCTMITQHSMFDAYAQYGSRGGRILRSRFTVIEASRDLLMGNTTLQQTGFMRSNCSETLCVSAECAQ